MKDRIQQFIDYKGITPGDLSTALDVQRSNISHILNGRNKPGAAFIEKFLLVYPDLNARWLLTGQGNMINEASTSAVDNSKSNSNVTESNSKKDSNKSGFSDSKNDSGEVRPQQSGVKEPNEEVEKLILVNSNGTFTIYNQKK